MQKKLVLALALLVIILLAVPLATPETPKQIQEAGFRTIRLLPEFLKEIWQSFLEFLQNLLALAKNIYDSYINPFFQNIWLKIKGLIKSVLRERINEWLK